VGEHAHSHGAKPDHGGARLLMKLSAEWAFLTVLRDEGRRAVEVFLTTRREDLGHRSSLDIDRLLEDI
jgi:hypothetical protein